MTLASAATLSFELIRGQAAENIRYLAQTAFVIKEAAGGQNVTVPVGSTANITIVPTLSTPAPSPLTIRPCPADYCDHRFD
jgi:hypothetical protein